MHLKWLRYSTANVHFMEFDCSYLSNFLVYSQEEMIKAKFEVTSTTEELMEVKFINQVILFYHHATKYQEV